MTQILAADPRRTTVVVEPGCTHEGDTNKFIALVDLAAQAGADAVKFQWTSDPERMAARRNAGEYLPYYQWLKFAPTLHETIARRCEQHGLAYGCTVYLPEDVAVVAPFVDFFKLSAFEAETDDMIDAIDAVAGDRAVVVSLGLGQHAALARVTFGDRCVLLRCVSAYPTPLEELRLARIAAEGLDGLSDHTAAADPRSLHVGGFAVVAGARWIERHYRLDDCRPSNPDYVVSLGGHQLDAYIDAIRDAETAIGSGTDAGGAMPCETPMQKHRATTDDETTDGDVR